MTPKSTAPTVQPSRKIVTHNPMWKTISALPAPGPRSSLTAGPTMRANRAMSNPSRPHPRVAPANVVHWCLSMDFSGGCGVLNISLRSDVEWDRLIQQRDGARGPAVAADQLDGESDECESLADEFTEVGQVLVVRDAVFAAHQMARVDAAGGVVRCWAIHAEGLDTAGGDPLAGRLAEAWVLAQVLRGAGVPRVRAGVQQEDVAGFDRDGGCFLGGF